MPEPTQLKGDPAAAASPQGLADRRELALVAVERTHMPMVVTDPRQPDNPVVLANRAFLNLTGYSPEEVIGRNCRFLQGKKTCPNAIAEVRAGLVEERDITVDLLNYRKDGSTFWNQLHLSPVHDERGNLVYFFGSQLDVTSRYEAEKLEASEYRLLREVDHRAKNALALVQGIVRLSRADNIASYAEAVQGRVEALARAHGMLADASWRGVPLDQLLHGEIAPFGSRRVKLDGPPMHLPAQMVQPVGLLIHELTSNAARHGALSAPEGALTVSWRCDYTLPAVSLHWQERGGPPAQPPRSQGFGGAMIRSIVERQLRGKMMLNWKQDGLEAELILPLAEGS